MSLLLTSPLVLVGAGLVALCAVMVWVGVFSGWFGHGEPWTVVVWPLPLTTLVAPLLAGLLWFLARSWGLAGQEGGMVAGLLYLAISVVPWLGATLVPPRWLLPSWARERIVAPPDAKGRPVPDAVPAVHAHAGRGHGGLSRWVWRVDGVPGFVWIDGEELRFRPVDPGPDQLRGWHDELDAAAIDQLSLDLATGTDLRLQPLRGGWWTRRRLDVELAAVDRSTWTARRPWARDGLLTMTVDGRGSARVWVADVDRLSARLATAPDTRSDLSAS